MADIEDEIVAKGLTPADIEANIVSEHYFTGANGCHGAWVAGNEGPRQATYPAALDLLTFCVLVLRNGFTVTGESACASLSRPRLVRAAQRYW